MDAQGGASVEVLVNNAGGGAGSLPASASVAEAAEHANLMLGANLLGAYLVTHALRARLPRPGGRIVNLSSIAARTRGGDAYSAAKAGVIGLTRALARELAPEGITGQRGGSRARARHHRRDPSRQRRLGARALTGAHLRGRRPAPHPRSFVLACPTARGTSQKGDA